MGHAIEWGSAIEWAYTVSDNANTITTVMVDEEKEERYIPSISGFPSSTLSVRSRTYLAEKKTEDRPSLPSVVHFHSQSSTHRTAVEMV